MRPFDDSGSEGSLDHAFERRLLSSARADNVPPAEVGAAWARFAGTATALTALSTSAQATRGAALGSKLAIAKWLFIGACCGGTLTAIWLRSPRHGTASAAAAVVSAPAPRVAPKSSDAVAFGAASAKEVFAGSVAAAPSATPSAALARGNTGAARISSTLPPERTNAGQRGLGSAVRSRPSSATSSEPALARTAARESSLGAEVALLDAALRASSAGAPAEALRLIDDYQRQFPAGELRADAEVVAIDALAAQRSSGLAERAARFLERYPNDPHAEHVKTLVPQR